MKCYYFTYSTGFDQTKPATENLTDTTTILKLCDQLCMNDVQI